MPLLLLLALAIAPGLLIAWFIYAKDKHAPEPHRRLLICFGWGAFTVIPSIILELLGAELADISPNIFITFLHAMVVVAAVEEGVKFAVLKWYIYNHDDFDEPLDGIVYAMMIGMGFATIENVLYGLSYGIEVTLLRMFTAVPAHAAFAVLMGYFVGLAKFEEQASGKRRLLVLGFAAPTLSHGLYDFFLFQMNFPALGVLALVVLVASLVFSVHLLRKHAELSARKNAEAHTNRNEEQILDERDHH